MEIQGKLGIRIARVAINMLAGVGILYVLQIFQIAERISTAQAIYAENEPPVRRAR